MDESPGGFRRQKKKPTTKLQRSDIHLLLRLIVDLILGLG